MVTGSRVGEGVGKGPETKLLGGGPHATQEAPEGACRAPKVPSRPDGGTLTGMHLFASENMHLLPPGFT